MPEGQASQTVDASWNPIAPIPIEGIRLVDVKNMITKGGALTEIYRPEWFKGEFDVQHVVHVSVLPGYTSKWHCHHIQADIVFPVRGYLRIGFYDGRRQSPTAGKSFVGTFSLLRPQYVVVPVGVWHAIRNIGSEEAAYIVLNDRPFDYQRPDDWLLPAGSDDIPVCLD